MREKFQYFLSLVTAYPKVTLAVGIFYLILSLLILAKGDASWIDSARTMLAQVLVLINLKVWLVAFFRDKIIFNPEKKQFGFLILMTFFLMFLEIIIVAPDFGNFVNENLPSEAALEISGTPINSNGIWVVPFLLALPVTILSLIGLFSKESMTLNRLFYLSLFFAITVGLINLYLWYQLPEDALVPMRYSSGEGFSQYEPKTDALIVWPILAWILPLMVKIGPYFPWLKMRTKRSFVNLAVIWLIIFLVFTAMEIFNVSNALN